MTTLFEAFLWRSAIVAGAFAGLIAVVILVRAVGAWRHKFRSLYREVAQTPTTKTDHAVPGVGSRLIPRHSTPVRRATARDIAQNGIFHDAA